MVLASVSSFISSISSGSSVMRCLACDCRLSDREANRKYVNHQEIKNPEARYIMLCDDCIMDTELSYLETQGDYEEAEEDTLLTFQDYQEEE